jgi:hypothetical protein
MITAPKPQSIPRTSKKMLNLLSLWEVKNIGRTLKPTMTCLQIVEGYAGVRPALGLLSSYSLVPTIEPSSGE